MAGQRGLSANLPSVPLQTIQENAAANQEPQEDLKKPLQDQYQQVVVNDFGALLSSQSQATNTARYWVLALGIVGTGAGSVIVPVLTAKAVVANGVVAAWGGVAGGSNSLQATIVGLSSQAENHARQKLGDSLQSAAKDYSEGWKMFPNDISKHVSAWNRCALFATFIPILRRPAWSLTWARRPRARDTYADLDSSSLNPINPGQS